MRNLFLILFKENSLNSYFHDYLSVARGGTRIYAGSILIRDGRRKALLT
jgi:hypothetical protein